MKFISDATNTRGGKVSTGIRAGDGVHTRGWDAGVKVTARERGHDEFDVYMTTGSHESGRDVQVGTVKDTPDGPRWEPAAKPGRIPARVGSPAMEVVAAIPAEPWKNDQEPREYICTVISRYWPSGEPVFGTVHAYRNGDRWSADAGHYDLSQSAAVHDMIKRVGCERPAATPEGND